MADEWEVTVMFGVVTDVALCSYDRLHCNVPDIVPKVQEVEGIWKLFGQRLKYLSLRQSCPWDSKYVQNSDSLHFGTCRSSSLELAVLLME